MDKFLTAVKGICIMSAAVFLMENLIGGTRLKNQVRLLLKLVFATALIYPFVKGGIRLELPDVSSYEYQNFSNMTELYNDELKRQSAENISSVLCGQIEAAGIKCEEIKTEVNISEDNIISISKVIITADDFEAAAEIVRNSAGSETEVVDGSI